MLSRATSAAAAQARAFSTAAQKRVVLVDGVRTPFAMSGTIYKDYIAQDLGRMAIKGLLTRTAYDAADLDYLIYGNVIQEGVCFDTCLERRTVLAGTVGASARWNYFLAVFCIVHCRIRFRNFLFPLRSSHLQHCSRMRPWRWSAQQRARTYRVNGLHLRQPGCGQRSPDDPVRQGQGRARWRCRDHV